MIQKNTIHSSKIKQIKLSQIDQAPGFWKDTGRDTILILVYIHTDQEASLSMYVCMSETSKHVCMYVSGS